MESVLGFRLLSLLDFSAIPVSIAAVFSSKYITIIDNTGSVSTRGVGGEGGYDAGD